MGATMVEIYPIDTGSFLLDGGSMFGVVPRALWGQSNPPDAKNRIRMGMLSLLVRHGEHKIIVDAGVGNYTDEKFRKLYPLDNPDFDFDEALSAMGEHTGSITDVVLTHLHFDHAGGIVRRREGRMGLTFERARIWVQRAQWQWAKEPSARDRASYFKTYMDVVGGSEQLRLVDGPGEILPGVEVLCFNGHTPGMQGVLIDAGEEKCFFAGDLIPLASHLRVPYIMAFDTNPLVTAEEKEGILERACAEHWLVYFQHDTECTKAHIVRENDRYIPAPVE